MTHEIILPGQQPEEPTVEERLEKLEIAVGGLTTATIQSWMAMGTALGLIGDANADEEPSAEESAVQ